VVSCRFPHPLPPSRQGRGKCGQRFGRWDALPPGVWTFKLPSPCGREKCGLCFGRWDASDALP